MVTGGRSLSLAVRELLLNMHVYMQHTLQRKLDCGVTVCLYLASSDMINKDRRGKRTGIARPSWCLNSITTEEPSDNDKIGSSKALCVSTWSGIPGSGNAVISM